MGKKLCCLFLSLILLLTGTLPVMGADLSSDPGEPVLLGQSLEDTDAEAEEPQDHVKSPLVRNADGMTDILRGRKSSLGSGSKSSVRLSSSESAAVNSAAQKLRSNMVNRVTVTEFYIDMPYGMDVYSLADLILDRAGQETSHSYEGDYLVYNLSSWQFDSWYYYGRRYRYVFHTYFRSTKEQERQVTSGVARVISRLGINSSTPDYQKIKKIYDYICDNIVYDYYHLYTNPDYELMYTAYAALIQKTAVCQGYALLLYRMLREVGIPCRTICGYSGSERHMWNIIGLRGTNYNADSTWDAGMSTYSYFLRGNAFFNTEHLRISTFNTSAYKTSSSDYKVKANDTVKYKLGTPKLKKAASAAYNKIKVTWGKVDNAKGYNVYVKKNGAWKKIGSTKATSFTYKVTPGVNYTFTVGAYQMSGGKKVQAGYDKKGITGKAVLARSNISSIVSTSTGLKLTWSKVRAATGYQVFRYNGGKWVKIKTVTGSSKTSYTDKTARWGITCQYRVRAFRREKGKLYFSSYSPIVKKAR